MEKYTNKLSQLDSKLKEYKAHDKEHVIAERKDLSEKLEAANAILQIKSFLNKFTFEMLCYMF